jgi:hypothetical protein
MALAGRPLDASLQDAREAAVTLRTSLSEAEEVTVAKPRATRLYISWIVALGLLLMGSLFCWKVVMPVMECSRVLSGHSLVGGLQGYYSSSDVIMDLGGPEVAVPKLSVYLRVPGTSDRNRGLAVDALKYCGPEAVPALQRLLSDRSINVRGGARSSLDCIEHMKGMTFDEKVYEDPPSAELDQ